MKTNIVFTFWDNSNDFKSLTYDGAKLFDYVTKLSDGSLSLGNILCHPVNGKLTKEDIHKIKETEKKKDFYKWVKKYKVKFK